MRGEDHPELPCLHLWQRRTSDSVVANQLLLVLMPGSCCPPYRTARVHVVMLTHQGNSLASNAAIATHTCVGVCYMLRSKYIHRLMT